MLAKVLSPLKKLYKKRLQTKKFRTLYNQAEDGSVEAQFELAKLYEEGSSIVEKNFIYAYYLYYISDKKGISEARECLLSLERQMSQEQIEKTRALISDDS